MKPKILPVDFSRKQRGYESLGGGIYRDRRTGNLYENPRVAGRKTWRKLQATTRSAAIKELRKKRSDQAMAQLGLAECPYTRTDPFTLAELLDFYRAKGCPRRRHGAVRAGKGLADELKRVEHLKAWPGSARAARDFALEHCREYHTWRTRQILRGKGGDRQVDKELVTLSSAFRCALRHSGDTGITANPIANDREQFRHHGDVVHCREHMPASGDELHALARYLFSVPRSEVLGMVLLTAAITGQRCHEVLKMRMDAKNKTDAGYWEGKRLYLYRSRTNKGTYGHVDLRPEEIAFLEAHHTWHRGRHALSPWYFPSPENSANPVGVSALTRRLDSITQAMGLPHRTSHGLRAFRVNVLRSRGMPDAEIALRIGQKTQGKLIVDVYGEGLDYTLHFMPDDGYPAWQKWASDGGEDWCQLDLL